MGIFRREPPEACAEDGPGELVRPRDTGKLAPLATPGMDAASRLVPVAARNARRSRLDDFRELFMPSPQRCWCMRRAALYDAFCGVKLCDSRRFKGGQGRDGSGDGKD